MYAIENSDLLTLLNEKRESYKQFGSHALQKDIMMLKKINAKDKFMHNSKKYEFWSEILICREYSQHCRKVLEREYYTDMSKIGLVMV